MFKTHEARWMMRSPSLFKVHHHNFCGDDEHNSTHDPTKMSPRWPNRGMQYALPFVWVWAVNCPSLTVLQICWLGGWSYCLKLLLKSWRNFENGTATGQITWCSVWWVCCIFGHVVRHKNLSRFLRTLEPRRYEHFLDTVARHNNLTWVAYILFKMGFARFANLHISLWHRG